MAQVQMQETDTQQPTNAVAPRTNRMAIWALTLAILTLGGIGSVLGIVLGVKARQRVQASGERGSRLALAAIIVGALTLLVAIGYWIVIAQHFGGTTGGGGTGGGSGY